MSIRGQRFFKSSFRLICAVALTTLFLGACGGGGGDVAAPLPQAGTTLQAVAQLPSSVQAGQPFVANALSSTSGQQGSALKYDWVFGSVGRAGSAQSPFVFTEPGNYNVTLTVRNDAGSVSFVQTSIAVTAPPAATSSGTVSVIVSEVNGAPIAGAQVLLAGQNAVSDALGVAVFTAVGNERDWVAKVSKTGYLPTALRSRFPANTQNSTVAATLLPRATGTQVDLAGAIEVIAPSGLRLNIPAGVLRLPDGSTPAGTASVHITSALLNNPQLGSNLSGALLTEQGAIAVGTSLQPYDIHIEQNGQKLNLASATAAQITWPLQTAQTPDGQTLNAGQFVPLHTYDENSGLWRQEGNAQVLAGSSASGLVMQATVGHFSYWEGYYRQLELNNPDYLVVVPECEIDQSSGLPTLLLGNNDRCHFDVSYDNPLKLRFPNIVPQKLGCHVSFISGNALCLVPTNASYDITAYLRADSNTLITQTQRFSANSPRPHVVRIRTAIPMNPDALSLSVLGAVSLPSEVFGASSTVTLKANVRAPQLWDSFDFRIDNVQHATTPSSTPTVTWNAGTFVESDYSVTVRGIRSGSPFVSSAPRVVRVDKTAPTLTWRRSGLADALNGQTQVPINSSVLLDFSEIVPQTPTLSIQPAVNGSWTKLSDTSWRFTPAQTLAENTIYTVNAAGVKDRVGNTANSQASFTTAAPAQGKSWGADNLFIPNAERSDVFQMAGNDTLALVRDNFPRVTAMYKQSAAVSFSNLGSTTVGFNATNHTAARGNFAVMAVREQNSTGLQVHKLDFSTANQMNQSEILNQTVFVNGLAANPYDVDVNEAGDVALVYLVPGSTPGYFETFVRRYVNGAWQTAQRVDNNTFTANTGARPRISLSNDGDINVIWVTTSSGAAPHSVVYNVYTASSATWLGQTSLSSNITLTPATIALKSNDAGQIMAAWQNRISGDSTNNSLPIRFGYAKKNSTASSFSVVSTQSFSLGFDIGISNGGDAYFVYINNSQVGMIRLNALGGSDQFTLTNFSAAEISSGEIIFQPRVAATSQGLIVGGHANGLSQFNPRRALFFTVPFGSTAVTALPVGVWTSTNSQSNFAIMQTSTSGDFLLSNGTGRFIQYR
jgi:PKD repeat protein